MNKYLYAILRLKTTSWIKYWLYNKTMKIKGVLSNILDGISFYLTDSLNRKFNLFQIIGRSVQDGTPTPENPIPIKNTGDNGSINEKVQNKNLFDSNAPTTTRGGVTLYNNGDGSYSLNGTFTGNTAFQLTTSPITLQNGKTYTQSIKVVSGTFKGLLVPSFKNSNGEIQYNYFRNNSTTTTTDTMTLNTYDYYISNGTTVNCTFKVQLEQGSTAAEYQAHEEQNISFPLAEGQKFMQGDYLADDGVHHVRKEVVLDGTENWRDRTETSLWYFATNDKPISIENQPCLCTHYISSVAPNTEQPNFSAKIGDINNYINILIKDNRFTTVEEWKAYLAEQYANGTPVKVQYELAQEVVDPYTPEQQQAWEQIKALRTYKNVTHISSEDELPANLKIQYWKEG